MRRSLVAGPVLLMMVLALSGCGDKGSQELASAQDPAPAATASTTPVPTATSQVSEREFCGNIVAVFSAGSPNRPSDPLNDLLADGVPAEMPEAAKDGVQVIFDNAGKLKDPHQVFDVYRSLSDEDRSAVNSLVTYIVTACGEDLMRDLIERLPSEVPEELKSLTPEDLPSELRNLLPSELPSALVGAIPEELASLIPEEWRSLIPEEYRSILENPSTSTAPRG